MNQNFALHFKQTLSHRICVANRPGAGQHSVSLAQEQLMMAAQNCCVIANRALPGQVCVRVQSLALQCSRSAHSCDSELIDPPAATVTSYSQLEPKPLRAAPGVGPHVV